MPITLSPLRYPGGKSKIYSYVRKLLEINNMLGQTYMEPFAGGAGLAIKLLLNGDVQRIIINDYDPAIFSFWYSVLHHTDDLCALIQNTEISLQEWHHQKDIYMQQEASRPLELGFATFFLNRTNISGIIKGGIIGGANQDGNFHIDARFNKSDLIRKVQNIAKNKQRIVLLNMDAKELIQPRQLGKYYKLFINFDPPYVKKGAKLYKNSFCENDHRVLSKIISQCNRKWIVTYDICPLVAELYNKFRCSYLDVSYSVKGNKKAKEYIFFSDKLVLPDDIPLISLADQG